MSWNELILEFHTHHTANIDINVSALKDQICHECVAAQLLYSFASNQNKALTGVRVKGSHCNSDVYISC